MNLLLRKRMEKLARRSPETPITQRMKSFAGQQHIKYVRLRNARPFRDHADAADVITLDGENLIPLSPVPFSPYMATLGVFEHMEDSLLFREHQGVRALSAEKFFAELGKLTTHFERKQWRLFDKEFQKLHLDLPVATEADRVGALFTAAELNGRFFCKESDNIAQRVEQRIALATNTSASLVTDLVHYFQNDKKDESLVRELWSIRANWSKCYGFLAPLFIMFYWDGKRASLDTFTLAQKRFDELKPFYVECFETFCRLSVIAAGVEGIVQNNVVGVPVSKGAMTLADFDHTNNGAKSPILKNLVIGDLFAPFIDHNLRNGIGHHSAHYDVKKDAVEYTNESKKGRTSFQISYIHFCEKVVRLYAQIEAVSLYAHWLRQLAVGIPWKPIQRSALGGIVR
jgi:hypothetical protein